MDDADRAHWLEPSPPLAVDGYERKERTRPAVDDAEPPVTEPEPGTPESKPVLLPPEPACGPLPVVSPDRLDVAS